MTEAEFQVMDKDCCILFGASVSVHTLHCLYGFMQQFEPEYERLGVNKYQLDVNKLKKELLKLTLGNSESICYGDSECTRKEILNDLLSTLSNRESGTYYVYYRL